MLQTRNVPALAVAVAFALAAVGAQGQPASPEVSSTAQALFDQGLADMLDGRYETGCPALAESFRLEPLPGVLFTLAECEYKWGKLATAQTHYIDFLNQVSRMAPALREKQRAREEVAREKLEKLKQEVPHLTIKLSDDAPARAVVKRNGEVVPPASLGQPIPLDPGDHLFTVEVDGEQIAAQTERLWPAQNRTVTLARAAPSPPEPPPDDGGSTLSTSQQWALGVGGLGVALLLVGTVTGAMAVDKKDDVDANCDGTVCNERGVEAAESGATLGDVSTATLIIGSAALVTGIVFWFAEPFDDEPPPDEGWVQLRLRPMAGAWPGPRPGGMIGVGGQW